MNIGVFLMAGLTAASLGVAGWLASHGGQYGWFLFAAIWFGVITGNLIPKSQSEKKDHEMEG
jgi:hypothetical protein